MQVVLLIRYGVIPEVARFRVDASAGWQRGERVVVRTHRGLETGVVLQIVADSRTNGATPDDEQAVLRRALPDDESQQRTLHTESAAEYPIWQRRIADWGLQLELIDLEWTLDRGKLVLYVLNDRGADCTKLAIYAAAEGLANVTVQPVDAGGLVQMDAGGGCGSGGCGSCGPH